MFRATSYAQVVETLKKPCANRSYNDVDYIIPWIQGLSKSFNFIPKDVLRTLLKESVFVTVPKGTPVTIQGEQGNCFYIVLRGRVSASGNTAHKPERIQLPPEIQLSSLDEKISQGVYETDPLPSTLNRSVFGNMFNEIVSGKSFGEIALMSDDNIRRATIIAEDVSDLLVVERGLYQRCLLQQHKSEFLIKGELFKFFPAVNEWNDREITNMALSLRLYQVKTGSNIVTQGEQCDGLHIIVKGQARISVEPGLHPYHFEKIFRLEPDETNSAHEKKSLFKPRNKCQFVKAASHDESVLTGQNILERAVKSISKHCPLSLCIVDPVAITGDIEFLLGWNVCYSTVTCTEDCQILQLDPMDCANIFRTRRKMQFFIKLARDKVAMMLRRWPEPGPIRLLNIAGRELSKLLATMPDVQSDGASRRKRFSLSSLTAGMSDTKRKESGDDQGDVGTLLRRLTNEKRER